jgi:hypothetical protein
MMKGFDMNSEQPLVPFSLRFAQTTTPTRDGDQTAGAETETQTSRDGIVRTDSEEDEDTD